MHSTILISVCARSEWSLLREYRVRTLAYNALSGAAYVQGMSDLLSPILFIMDGDEPEGFWAFAGLMDAVETSFQKDQACRMGHIRISGRPC